MHKYDTSSVEDVFVLLQRATREGNEHDRAFALILLGALATPKALDIVRSFLASPSLKERWASVIALGRHKEERVFPLLQTLLLDGFLVRPLSTSEEEAERQGGSQGAYPPIGDLSVAMEYEWYMHQRWECALVLGAWGNPCVVPLLREALQTAWKMEQMWPDYALQWHLKPRTYSREIVPDTTASVNILGASGEIPGRFPGIFPRTTNASANLIQM